MSYYFFVLDIMGCCCDERRLFQFSNCVGFMVYFEWNIFGYFWQIIDSAGCVLQVEIGCDGRIEFIIVLYFEKLGEIFEFMCYVYDYEGNLVCSVDVIGGSYYYCY